MFMAISLCAPIASGLAMAFPVFALTVYQDDPGGGGSGGGNPDNPLVRPLDTEQGSWFGQHPMLNHQMICRPTAITVTLVVTLPPPTSSSYFALKG